MVRLLCIAVLTVLAIVTIVSADLAHANRPAIKSVVVFDVDGNTNLNVTINHLDQNEFHYVDEISVDIIDLRSVNFPLAYQPTAPNGDVVYQCDLGLVPEDRNALLTAKCLIHGPSLDVWSGIVPEFSPPISLLALALIAASVAFAARKIRSALRH